MTQLLKTGALSFHGIIVAVAVIIMILYALYYTKLRRYDVTTLMYITPASIFFGFAGARLLYVTVCDQLYVEPAEKWRLTDGGYALFGAAAGVVLTVIAWWLINRRKPKLLPVFDTLCVSAPLAIALGRLGSVFSEDCLGSAVEADGLKFFPIAIFKQSDGQYHYAVFFYEAAICLIIFFAVRFADKKYNRPGVASFVFGALYCGARSFLEVLREDSMHIGFVPVNQVIAIFTLIGLFVYASVRLARTARFKKIYILSYIVFAASFVTAFFSMFYMYSTNRVRNTLFILICCIVMTVLTLFTGSMYIKRIKKEKKAAHKKRLPDKTQRFDRVNAGQKK